MVYVEKDDVVYRELDENFLDEVIECATSHFIDNEYLTKESKLSHIEFRKLVETHCKITLIEKLSIIACNKKSNRVIGFSISEDPKSQRAVHADQFILISKNFIPFFKILESLHRKCFKLNIKQGECFHLFLLGVLPEYQGRKIGKTLVQLSEQHAIENKFKHLLIEATSPITKPLCESLNYRNLGNIVYRDYVLDNRKPFAHLLDFEGPYMFIKDLI